MLHLTHAHNWESRRATSPDGQPSHSPEIQGEEKVTETAAARVHSLE